jgi:peptide/nickel transport system substrate-binding protein
MLEKKKLILLFPLVLALLAGLLVACRAEPAAVPTPEVAPPLIVDTPAAPPEPADTPAPPPEPADTPAPPPEPAERKVATFIFTQEFDSLNPFYTAMWFSAITNQIWNAWAIVFDEQNNPIPYLLTEIPDVDNGGISADGRVITFNLRDDLRWSDGTPLTAEDFIFTYEMAIDPANIVQSTYPYDQVQSMEAPDEGTVVVNFAEPFVPWVATLWQGILPAHILQPVFESEGTLDRARWNMAPTVSAGPYVFSEWESGSFTRFVRNDNYWGAPPIIDEIFIRFVPDDAAQVAALQAGDADLGTFIAYSDVPTLERAGVNVVSVPSGYNEGWYIFVGDDDIAGHPALQDVRVRQAIAMAFDRFSLNEDLLLGLTQPAATLWDNTPFVDPSIEPWPYDPDRARQLLDEAGWVDSNGDGVRDQDGVELVLRHGSTTRQIRQDTQAVAQQQLAEVGIRLEISNYPPDIFFAGYPESPAATGDLEISQWSDSPAFPDPDHSYWLCSEIPTDESPFGSNYQRICDEELDELFRLQSTQIDFAERQETFYRITRIMFDEVYWLGIWEDPDIWALSDRLQNARLSGVTPFFNVAEWDLR